MSALDALMQRSGLGPWLQAQSPRDRLAVYLLTAFLAAVVLWVAVLQPVMQWRAAAAARYEQQLAALTWMQANRGAVVAAANRAGASAGDQGLLSTVAAQARANRVTLSRYQPESNGQVTVELQDQNFNDVIRWVQRLQTTQGIQVTFVNLQRTERDGYVNGRLRFRL